MTQLTRKAHPFAWTDETQTAFETLKKAFTTAVILMHFDPNRPIIIETDASDYVSAPIMSQYDDAQVPRRTSTPTSGLPLQKPVLRRMQLQDLRQGTTCDHLSLRRMATGTGRSEIPHLGDYRPQQPRVLHNEEGTQPQTSAMVRVPIMVTLRPHLPTRKTRRETR